MELATVLVLFLLWVNIGVAIISAQFSPPEKAMVM